MRRIRRMRKDVVPHLSVPLQSSILRNRLDHLHARTSEWSQKIAMIYGLAPNGKSPQVDSGRDSICYSVVGVIFERNHAPVQHLTITVGIFPVLEPDGQMAAIRSSQVEQGVDPRCHECSPGRLQSTIEAHRKIVTLSYAWRHF